jgi:hypothetical protein
LTDAALNGYSRHAGMMKSRRGWVKSDIQLQ